MKQLLLAIAILTSCSKDQKQDVGGAPASGLYASAQFTADQVKITKDIQFSVRPNAGNQQYTSDLRKASENGAADLKLLLDIAIPPNAVSNAPQPLVILIHGGGFTAGNKEDAAATAISYARAGYIAATINYRLTANNAVSAQKFIQSVIHATEDAMNAIRFLKSRSGMYHIDTNRIATVGASAGGGISLVNAVSYDALAGTVSDYPAISSRVQGAVSTGATLVQPGIPSPQMFMSFGANDSPVLLFHANPTDGTVGTTWNDHVLPTQKLIKDSGNECIVVAQPDRSHTVDLSPGSIYWKQCNDFLWKNLDLKNK